MSYVNVFVASIAPDRKADYLAMSEAMDAFFKQEGANRVVECWGKDDVPHGKQTDFYRAVDAREGEAIIVGWIEWPSKAVADAAMAKMEQNPEMMGEDSPFDMQKMIFGGFEMILEM